MPRSIDPTKPYFTIGAVAEILGIKPRMLRVYEERGLVTPSRTEGNRRLYSLHDIDILAYVQYLTSVKRVNIAGVLEIQKILRKLDSRTRSAFMKEIEEEIAELPQEQRKAFVGNEEVEATLIREAESYRPFTLPADRDSHDNETSRSEHVRPKRRT
jgi:DNA-binding transcriptional MerR regulator